MHTYFLFPENLLLIKEDGGRCPSTVCLKNPSVFLVNLAVSQGVWDSGQVPAAHTGALWVPFWRLRAGFGSAQGCSRNAVQGLPGRAPGTHSQPCSVRAALRHCAPSPSSGGHEETGGVSSCSCHSVSSPGSWKSISTSRNREPGLTSISNTTCIRERLEQQIMFLKRTINSLLIISCEGENN